MLKIRIITKKKSFRIAEYLSDNPLEKKVIFYPTCKLILGNKCNNQHPFIHGYGLKNIMPPLNISNYGFTHFVIDVDYMNYFLCNQYHGFIANMEKFWHVDLRKKIIGTIAKNHCPIHSGIVAEVNDKHFLDKENILNFNTHIENTTCKSFDLLLNIGLHKATKFRARGEENQVIANILENNQHLYLSFYADRRYATDMNRHINDFILYYSNQFPSFFFNLQDGRLGDDECRFFKNQITYFTSQCIKHSICLLKFKGFIFTYYPDRIDLTQKCGSQLKLQQIQNLFHESFTTIQGARNNLFTQNCYQNKSYHFYLNQSIYLPNLKNQLITNNPLQSCDNIHKNHFEDSSYWQWIYFACTLTIISFIGKYIYKKCLRR